MMGLAWQLKRLLEWVGVGTGLEMLRQLHLQE